MALSEVLEHKNVVDATRIETLFLDMDVCVIGSMHLWYDCQVTPKRK